MAHNPRRTELRYGHGRLVSPKHNKGSRPHAASLCANASCSDMPLGFILLLHKSRGAPEDLWTVDDHICGMTDRNKTKSFSEASASAGEAMAIISLELQRKRETDRRWVWVKLGPQNVQHACSPCAWVGVLQLLQLSPSLLLCCFNKKATSHHTTEDQSPCEGYRGPRCSPRRSRTCLTTFPTVAAVNGSTPVKEVVSSSWGTISLL